MFRPDPKKKPRIKAAKVNNPHKLKGYNCKVCECRYRRKMSDTNIKWCSPECHEEYKELALQAAAEQEPKVNEKSLTDWHDELQAVINPIAKWLDKDLPCIATGETKGEMHAGHHFSIGSWPSLRHNLWNIHKQCFDSNIKKAGDEGNFANGLKERYGPARKSWIDTLKILYPALKLSIPEIQNEYLPNAKVVLKELKNGADLTRDQVNEMIGIY